MNKIIISDLHLDDTQKNDYMWEIFPWLFNQIDKYDVQLVYILGDITDKKDRHPSRLVNRFCKFLDRVFDEIEHEVHFVILKGNHDFVDEGSPFFEFLKGKGDRVSYIKEPWDNRVSDNLRNLLLPYTDTPEDDWEDFDFTIYKTVFMHQEVEGCVFANQHITGRGISKDYFSSRGFKGMVYSGHIHVPQIVGKNITYVGAPYSVRFGDSYLGRALLVGKDNKVLDSLYPDFLRKYSVRIEGVKELDEYEIASGDRLKIEIILPRCDMHLYDEMREGVRDWCQKHDIELCGIKANIVGRQTKTTRRRRRGGRLSNATDAEIVQRFGVKEKLSKKQIAIGEELING